MSTQNTQKSGRLTALWPLILITALFFFWGMANNLNDVLIPQFKKAFSLSNLESSLVQSAFYMGYFIMALPAGFLMRRFGYKVAVVTGLCLFAIGAFLFFPAAEIRQYGWFLGALFVIASGLAFLETSANPLITVLGDPKGAAFRLNLAQAFNPLGSLLGIWVGKTFILSGIEAKEVAAKAALDAAPSAAALEAFHIAETKAVQMPYLVLGCVILAWAVLVAVSKFPKSTQTAEGSPAAPKLGAVQSVTGLFKHKRFLLGVVAQFFYVGAQVGVWSYMIKYGQTELGLTDKAAADYLFYTLVLFLVGRFVGTALMSRVSPILILGVFAVINIALTATAASVGGLWGMYALVATSAFMSIMFPTIFAVSVRDLGPLTETGSSLLVMSIVGGFLLTNLMGHIADLSHIRTAIIVPLVCFAVIALFAFSAPKDESEALDLSRSH
jgi:MFS transporter, FHS family, L-fucose permease